MTGRVLFLDLETRSAVDLKARGVHVYARDPSTDVWCACYAFSDDRRVRTWLPGSAVPTEIVEHVEAGGLVSAHNFGFESALWTHVLTPRHGWPVLRPEQGHCTAAEAAAMALPRSLDGCAAALRLGAKKDPAGYQTMLRMCRPRRELNDGTLVWWDEPERLAQLIAYCVNDVEMEMLLYDRLLRLSAEEHRIWSLDIVINERGVAVDHDLVAKAGVLAEQAMERANARLYRLTGKAVEKFTQNARLLAWLQKQGVDTESLDKNAVRHLLRGVSGPLTDTVREILELRREAAKASVAKLAAMQAWSCPDGRVRGMLLYHGATTGRWSGKGPQPQNLPRPSLSQDFIDAAIADVKGGCDLAWLETMYGPGLVTVADIIRGCLIAAPGKRFVMADFSNIEGRVLAWLAGEDWKVEAFRRFDARTGPDLYLVAAAGIYGVPVSTLNKKSPERQIGKVAELALGFQGGVGAFQKMAEGSGVEVSDERADEIKTAWRAKHPATVQLWRDLESAALEACRFPGRVVSVAGGKIRFVWRDKFLWCRLPSRRVLSYASAKLDEVETPWGEKRAGVTAMTPKGGAFFRRAVYGGGLTENCLAGDTEVCVRRDGEPHRWTPIREIGLDDKVWDGRAWVAHRGLLRRGVEPVIDFGGVRMTPDHLVWCGARNGWRQAAKTDPAYPRYVVAAQYLKDLPHPGRIHRGPTPAVIVGEEEVFDLLDCGPRHRFVVRGPDRRPFIVHNCVQAIARDLMAEAMLRLEAAGYPVVLTVHDEVLSEVPDGFGSVEEFVGIMSAPVGWAEGCPVTAEGGSGYAYKK